MEHIEATELNTGDNGNTFIDLWLGMSDSGIGELLAKVAFSISACEVDVVAIDTLSESDEGTRL